MTRRVVADTTITPTATGDGANLVDNTYPCVVQGGSTTQRNGIWEVYCGGQTAATSSPTYMILGMDSQVGTGSNTRGSGQTDAPMDSLAAALAAPVLTGNQFATNKPQRSSTLHLINMAFNTYGGISKWQAYDSEGRVLIYGNAANVGEVSLSAFTGGTTGAMGFHLIYETI